MIKLTFPPITFSAGWFLRNFVTATITHFKFEHRNFSTLGKFGIINI